MQRLATWIHLNQTAKFVHTYRQKGSRTPGMLDGARHLYKSLRGKAANFDQCEESLKLFLSLFVAGVSKNESEGVPFAAVMDRTVREYAVLQSMNDPEHIRVASNLMMRNDIIFFGRKIEGGVDSLDEQERNDLLAKATPHARLLWHFCVLLCRELFEGEHILTPEDAQLLGVIDEISGGGPVMSVREWEKTGAGGNVQATKRSVEG